MFGVFCPTRVYLYIWKRHITDEGLQILTYGRHLWPLSIEGSLVCHAYCDKGLELIICEVVLSVFEQRFSMFHLIIFFSFLIMRWPKCDGCFFFRPQYFPTKREQAQEAIVFCCLNIHPVKV